MLFENDVEFAIVKCEDKQYTLEKLEKKDLMSGLENGDFNDLKEYVEMLLRGEKPQKVSLKDCVLLDIKDVAYLTAVYKKPYYKEFLQYVKEHS